MKVKLLFNLDLSDRLVVAEARNFLFNYLFARHHHGQLLLRLDALPEQEASFSTFQELVRWIGIDLDAEQEADKTRPIRRSERLQDYSAYAHKLIEKNLAYRCFCSRETLRDMTNAQKIHGQTPRYDQRCLRISGPDRENLLAKGTPYQIRLRKPEVVSEVHDLVRGRMVFDTHDVADLIILRYDGTPGTALANVVDHHLLGITHVMRGDRHKAETPREAFLRQAFDLKSPEYVHLPLILGEDRSLLSERHGDKYFDEYRSRGYMADALLNYLLEHGLNRPVEEQPVLRSLGQMVKLFKLDDIQQNPSIWQVEKLNDLNRRALEKFKDDALAHMLAPYVAKEGYDLYARGDAWAREFVGAIRPSLKTLSDVKESVEIFFADKITPDKKGQTLLKDPDAKKVVETLEAAAEKVSEVTSDNYRELLDAARSSVAAKSKALMLIRVSLTGREIGPDFVNLFSLLGKQRLLSRLENARRYIPKGMKKES